MSFETVIGLEIHAQLLTKTKLFCACPVTFGEEPNTNTCPVCLGLPGSLPVLNENAVVLAAKAAVALNCKVNNSSIFSRKNYFYPDLPKGYQISQYDKPLAEKGHLEIEVDGKRKKIGITRVHLEEDAGKLLHEGSDKFSLVDYNRSCVPLIEIVSEPEISSPEEAAEYLKMLRRILDDNKICDGNMELGNLRCDANLSVRKEGDKKLGTKTELKNMNSVNFIQKALEYERKRHIETLEKGGRIVQETLLWDTNQNKTVSMRTKEEAHDYRYFPEPDLLPLKLEGSFIDKIESNKSLVRSKDILNKMEETKLKDKKRIEEDKLSKEQAKALSTNSRFDAIYDKITTAYWHNKPRSAALIISNTTPILKNSQLSNEVIASYAIEIQEAEDSGRINQNTGTIIFKKAVETTKSPKEIIKQEGLIQISDSSEIDSLIDNVLSQFPEQVKEYKSGKEAIFNFILGQVMRATKGKVNPKTATEQLIKKLKR